MDKKPRFKIKWTVEEQYQVAEKFCSLQREIPRSDRQAMILAQRVLPPNRRHKSVIISAGLRAIIETIQRMKKTDQSAPTVVAEPMIRKGILEEIQDDLIEIKVVLEEIKLWMKNHTTTDREKWKPQEVFRYHDYSIPRKPRVVIAGLLSDQIQHVQKALSGKVSVVPFKNRGTSAPDADLFIVVTGFVDHDLTSWLDKHSVKWVAAGKGIGAVINRINEHLV